MDQIPNAESTIILIVENAAKITTWLNRLILELSYIINHIDFTSVIMT